MFMTMPFYVFPRVLKLLLNYCRFQTGSGQAGVFTEGPQIRYISQCFALTAYILQHVSMKVDYGELRHFCDEPVCPDPVWKLSTLGSHSLNAIPLGGM